MNFFWKELRSSSGTAQCNKSKITKYLKKRSRQEKVKLMAMFYGVNLTEENKKRY